MSRKPKPERIQKMRPMAPEPAGLIADLRTNLGIERPR
jgi:hypothetical protein